MVHTSTPQFYIFFSSQLSSRDGNHLILPRRYRRLTFPSSLGALLMRGGGQRSLDFSRESWTAYVIVSVVGKQSSGFGAHTISITVVPRDKTYSDFDAMRTVYSDALNMLLDSKSFNAGSRFWPPRGQIIWAAHCIRRFDSDHGTASVVLL